MISSLSQPGYLGGCSTLQLSLLKLPERLPSEQLRVSCVHVLPKGTLAVWKAVIVPSSGTLAPHGALHKPGETKAFASTRHPIHQEDIID